MKYLKTVSGLCISGLFLYLVFRKMNFTEMLQVISSTNIYYVLLLFIIGIPTLMVKSLRWKIMFADGGKIPLMRFFDALGISSMVNNLIPFRAGDITQIVVLNRNSGLSKSIILSTLVVQRLCDFFTLCMILFCGSFFVLLPKEMSKERIVIVMAAAVLAVAAFFGLQRHIMGFFEKILPPGRFRDRVTGIMGNFYTGFRSVNNIKLLSQIIFLTAVLWLASALGLLLCLLSVNIKVSFFTSVFFLALTGISSIIPLAPANLGPLEFFITTGLVVLGIDRNVAVSFAVVYRMISWLPSTLLGLALLLKYNFSMKQLVHFNTETRQ